jgi:hypothetical protein
MSNFKNNWFKRMRGSTTGSVVYFAPFDQRKSSKAVNGLGKRIGTCFVRYSNLSQLTTTTFQASYTSMQNSITTQDNHN